MHITSEQTPDELESRTMPVILEELKLVRDERARLRAELDDVEQQEAHLRAELHAGMTKACMVNAKGFGLVVTMKRRSSHLVLDQLALTEALDKAGILPKFLRLDTRPAAKYGAEHGLPGVAFDEITYLSISEVIS